MMAVNKLSLPTRVAIAGLYEDQFCGYPVFSGLLGTISYTGMLLLATGGKKLSIEETEVIDDLAVVLAMADPRIWAPKIARLASCYGNFEVAMSTPFLTLSKLIGAGTISETVQQLLDIKQLVEEQKAEDDEAIKKIISHYLSKKKLIYGLGLSGRPIDQRLTAFIKSVEKKKLNKRTFWHLQELVSEIGRKERKLEPNIVMGAAGVFLDFGLDVKQSLQLFQFIILIPYIANASEGSKQAPEILQCLPKEYIEEKMEAPRKSSRALGLE